MNRKHITLRIGNGALHAATTDSSTPSVIFQPFTVKSGISMAANLREAFRQLPLLNDDYASATVIVDSPTLIIPKEEVDDNDATELMHYTFPDAENALIMTSEMSFANAVAAFALNKDLRLVVDDHFKQPLFLPLIQPVWRHFQRRSFNSLHQTLYGYFHDRKLDIFCFNKNRFKFSNSYEVTNSRDAAYYILYVWKQLALNAERDAMVVFGDVIDSEWLIKALQQYVANVTAVADADEFGGSPVVEVKNMPFDLKILLDREL